MSEEIPVAILPPATFRDFTGLSTVEEDAALPDATGMIRNLIAGHEIVVANARELAGAAEQASDIATVDLATRRVDVHQKTAWMLRSLLE